MPFVLFHNAVRYMQLPTELGPFLSSNFFSEVSFFFPRKAGIAEKQDTFPKSGKLTGAKTFGRLRIPMFGKKWKIWKYKKLQEKKSCKFSKKVLR